MTYTFRLDKTFEGAKRLPLNKDTKYVLFSDCHRGSGTSNDNFLKNRSTILRGGIYTILIFTAEYCFGSLLRAFDMCPWDYTGSKLSINGLIRLDYAPAWFIAGLIMERIVRK